MFGKRRLLSRAMFVLAAALLLFPASALAQIQLSTERPSYAPGENITVTWSGLPGNAQDWLTLVPAGSSNEEWGDWTYTNGQVSGSYTFSGVDAGQYEVRVYLNWPAGGYQVAASLPVSVGGGSAGGVTSGGVTGGVTSGGPQGGRTLTATKDTSNLTGGADSAGSVTVSPDPQGSRTITSTKDTSNLPSGNMGPSLDSGPGGMGPGGGMPGGDMGPGGGMGPGNNLGPGGGTPGGGPGKGGGTSDAAPGGGAPLGPGDLNLPSLGGLGPDQVVMAFYDYLLQDMPALTPDQVDSAAPTVADHFFSAQDSSSQENNAFMVAMLMGVISSEEGTVELINANYSIESQEDGFANVRMTGTARLTDSSGVDDESINDLVALTMNQGVWQIQEIITQ